MVSQEGAVDTGLKAIADSTRRGILTLLQGGQRSVLEIAEKFPMSRPAISKHLRILKEAGLVLETPSGRQRLYELETGPLVELAGWLARFNGQGSGGRSLQRVSGAAGRSVVRRQVTGDSAADWRVW